MKNPNNGKEEAFDYLTFTTVFKFELKDTREQHSQHVIDLAIARQRYWKDKDNLNTQEKQHDDLK